MRPAGAGLLRDVIERAAAISEEIGCRGLLVHCESDQVRKFYLHLVSLHLVLLLKGVKRTLRRDPR